MPGRPAIPCARIAWALLALATPALSQDNSGGPSNSKAQKTYKEALEYLRRRQLALALDDFKKADQQDEGHCLSCQKHMVRIGMEEGDWKAAELGAQEMIAEAQSLEETAVAYYQFALVLQGEGVSKHKDDCFARAREAIAKTLAAKPDYPEAVFLDGKMLAHLHQDDAARARFEEFVKARPEGDPSRARALRYIQRPESARARLAPPFSVVTAEGQKISLDDLQGKVVLLDFWATWCAPCRAALPHLRGIAKAFRGQPLVILSVSLDDNEEKWRDFVARNEMAWPQYRDGGFTGRLARLFDVRAIPHTFTIDADGVLQDEHVGDAQIEGRLNKLVRTARDLQAAQAK